LAFYAAVGLIAVIVEGIMEVVGWDEVVQGAGAGEAFGQK